MAPTISATDSFPPGAPPAPLPPIIIPEQSPEVAELFRFAKSDLERLALAAAIIRIELSRPAVESVPLDGIIEVMSSEGFDQFDVRLALQALADRRALQFTEELGDILVSLGKALTTREFLNARRPW